MKRAVVIHAPEGALWTGTDEEALWIPYKPVSPGRIVSPVGAGDDFCAAMIYGIHEGWPCRKSLDVAHLAYVACLGGATATDGIPAMGALLSSSKPPPAEPQSEQNREVEMKALFLEDVGKLSLREVEKPVPQEDELLVRVEACGICGTDRHLYLGEFPSRPPVTLGHEFSGIVEAVGRGVTAFKAGMRVTGDPNIACGRCAECHRGRVNLCHNLQAIGIHRNGGFAEYVAIPEKQAFELPLTIDPLLGAFCEPLACCLHGVDLAKLQAGSSAIVIGGGVIGLLVVQLVRLAGARHVVLVTRSEAKRKLAESLGATASIDPSQGDVVDRIVARDGLLPGGADVVFECAGLKETVEQAPRLTRRGGMTVVLGVLPSGQKVEIEPFDLLFREIGMVTSFLNPFTHRRAAELIASGTIAVAPLVSRTIGLDEAIGAISSPAIGGEIRTLVVPGLRAEATPI